MRFRLVSVILGQGSLSLGNLVLTVTAARTLDASAFGIFAFAWSWAVVWPTFVRTAVGPAIVTGVKRPSWVHLGILVSALSLVPALIGIVILKQGTPSPLLQVAFIAVFPATTVFELRRLRASVDPSRKTVTLRIDATYLITVASVAGISLSLGFGGVEGPMLGLVLGGIVAATGRWQDPIEIRARLREWLSFNRSILSSGFVEWSAFAVAAQATVSVVAVVGGAEVVGALRIAQLFYSPVAIALSGLILANSMTLREARASGSTSWPPSYRASLGWTSAGVAAYSAIIVLLPDSVLALAAGGSASNAGAAIWGYLPGVLVAPFAAHLSLWMRVSGKGRALSRTRVALMWLEPTAAGLGARTGSFWAAGGVSLAQVTATASLAIINSTTATPKGRHKTRQTH